ncbi:hypothetical protein FRACYDRAFT_236733 [Fragilariopsis cylindrus CCMP1102]|uniref:Uncharacterized protein n=1 Tax=Fragilariopsis cylindrus CCMP1102 TaxID=635003 RepID=A0A1E7FJX7_9STRA|nr:hypothetical protein FRACYDRAFT_236733 [Fragilariopsis cylindrus CCMP1102]|eukprot:OEU18457.1 hypothetical protein FRACYDRAFT_236733 [Fragilariopsis cylindrus CCMP1102]
MYAATLYILCCFLALILVAQEYYLALISLFASSSDIDDTIIDCNGDINDEQHINNYGSFSKIDESINKKPGYDAMTKEERIELLQEDKLPPPLKPAISSSTSSSSSPQSPLKLKSATTTTTTTTRTKTKNKTTTHRSTGVAVTRTTADSNLDKIRVSFDNFKDENDNNDGGDNASIMSALTMRENFTMSTSSNTPMTTTTTASNSINKKKKKENPILKKFLSLWKVTTKNTSSRRKKNNNTLQNNNNNNNSNNDDEGDDEEDVYNGDSDADGGTTTISVSPINSNINSNINSSNKSSSSCLILLMEPISRTFEIMTIQYSPGISTVSNILEDIPLQSTFNFRLRFTNYIGLLGVGMTTVTTTTTTKKKKKNEEMKEVDMTTTITNCSHIHQLLQSKPVSKQYSCEYQFQQQKLLVEEKQEQEQQQQKEETKKHFMMVLVAILPDRCSGKNSTITKTNGRQ